MADLEERVATLEREMTEVKSAVADMKADVESLPDLIRAGFLQVDRQLAALRADVATDTTERLEALHRDLSKEIDETRAQVMARVDRRCEELGKAIGDLKKSS